MENRLKEVKTIIFDMDGVITSEEKYFDSAGLTVLEILESPQYLNLGDSEEFSPSQKEKDARKYLPENVIKEFKLRGVNTNWDLAYLTVSSFLLEFLELLFFEDKDFVTSILKNGFSKGNLKDFGRQIKPHLNIFQMGINPVLKYLENSKDRPVGFFQIGGGIAGDFPICVVPLIRQDMQKNCRLWGYFCQISDSTTSYGSYSGAVPNEKITWEKLGIDTPRFVIESDASIVAPLIFQCVLEG